MLVAVSQSILLLCTVCRAVVACLLRGTAETGFDTTKQTIPTQIRIRLNETNVIMMLRRVWISNKSRYDTSPGGELSAPLDPLRLHRRCRIFSGSPGIRKI